MSRTSPVISIKFRQPVDPRQDIWDVLRARATEIVWFTAAEVSRRSHCHIRTVRSYMTALTGAGILEQRQEAPLAWRLVQDKGRRAPRVRPDGALVGMGKGRSAAWQGMRIMKKFSARELHVATGVPEADIRSFITYLVGDLSNGVIHWRRF